MTSDSKRGINYEKRICAERGGKHMGGAGRPDYKCRDGGYGEVKCYDHPLTKGELMREFQKRNGTQYSLTEFVSKKGYTPDAEAYCKRYYDEVRLLKGAHEVVKRAHR